MRAQLAAGALVQVTLDGAGIWVRGEVHVVTHLNRVLDNADGLIADHLSHEILVRHLKVLLL